MASPFEDARSEAVLAKLNYERLNEKAQEAYQAFKAARKKGLDDGDVTIDVKGPISEELKTLQAEYEAAADAADAAKATLFKTLERGGDARTTSLHKGGIGAEFVRAMEAGPGGLKALDGTTGGTMVGPAYDSLIRDLPQRRLFLRTLVQNREADSDKVWFLRQTVATQNAAPVAAGAVKPTSVYTIERVEQPVTTIAHVTEAIDRALLADKDELIQFLNTQLGIGVLLAEENQMLNGSGAGANLRGILNTSGILSTPRGTDNRPDAIYNAITNIRLQNIEPNGIVLHPTDWKLIREEKDANGNYITGDVLQADPDRLWGYPVAVSAALAQGTGLVGDFTHATLWQREGTRLTFAETGLGDGAGTEMFLRNQVRWRAEERVAFGVTRPSAFSAVTGL